MEGGLIRHSTGYGLGGNARKSINYIVWADNVLIHKKGAVTVAPFESGCVLDNAAKSIYVFSTHIYMIYVY